MSYTDNVFWPPPNINRPKEERPHREMPARPQQNSVGPGLLHYIPAYAQVKVDKDHLEEYMALSTQLATLRQASRTRPLDESEQEQAVDCLERLNDLVLAEGQPEQTEDSNYYDIVVVRRRHRVLVFVVQSASEGAELIAMLSRPRQERGARALSSTHAESHRKLSELHDAATTGLRNETDEAKKAEWQKELDINRSLTEKAAASTERFMNVVVEFGLEEAVGTELFKKLAALINYEVSGTSSAVVDVRQQSPVPEQQHSIYSAVEQLIEKNDYNNAFKILISSIKEESEKIQEEKRSETEKYYLKQEADKKNLEKYYAKLEDGRQIDRREMEEIKLAMLDMAKEIDTFACKEVQWKSAAVAMRSRN